MTALVWKQMLIGRGMCFGLASLCVPASRCVCSNRVHARVRRGGEGDEEIHIWSELLLAKLTATLAVCSFFFLKTLVICWKLWAIFLGRFRLSYFAHRMHYSSHWNVSQLSLLGCPLTFATGIVQMQQAWHRKISGNHLRRYDASPAHLRFMVVINGWNFTPSIQSSAAENDGAD